MFVCMCCSLCAPIYYRELVVQTHNLERKLQELQGLETRHSDLCDEVTELKFKVDQMPPLLAELARLRGSHRYVSS